MIDSRAIQIHTDGSCYMHQSRISGCAAWVIYPDHLALPEFQIVDYGCAEDTNIRMELMACAKGLKWAIENEPWQDVTRIYIVTDLEFLANNRNNIQYWKQKGWRYSSGEPVAHEDLWDDILKSILKLSKVGLRVDFHYKKGKKDVIGKKVDAAAKLPHNAAVSIMILDSNPEAIRVRWCRVVQRPSGFRHPVRRSSYVHTRKTQGKNEKRR